MSSKAAKPVLVIGGGIAGMTTALEVAEVGYRAILVEKEPYLGGRVLRMHRYFPKMCPPSCGFEINTRRLRRNPRIEIHTLATVEELAAVGSSFTARVKKQPRYVTGECSIDDSVAEALSGERPDDFNYGMGTTKALYMPHDMAYPAFHVLDRDNLTAADVAVLEEKCPPGAIDLDMEEEEIAIEAGAVVVATGWRPYDATLIEKLGFGRHPNVITNVMMERLAARRGPTAGKILRPSDGRPARRVAFVQCAGSRDVNHLAYCSAICCMASLKQVRYLREQDEEATATVFYIDIRTVGSLEKFYYDMLDDQQVSFIKGKVVEIEEDDASHNLILSAEDTLTGEMVRAECDLVVLATGMVPNTADVEIPGEKIAGKLSYDEYGFLSATTDMPGLFVAGCVQRPCDVSRTTKEATAAALKAIQYLKQGE